MEFEGTLFSEDPEIGKFSHTQTECDARLFESKSVVKGELWRWLHLLLQLSSNVQHYPQI